MKILKLYLILCMGFVLPATFLPMVNSLTKFHSTPDVAVSYLTALIVVIIMTVFLWALVSFLIYAVQKLLPLRTRDGFSKALHCCVLIGLVALTLANGVVLWLQYFLELRGYGNTILTITCVLLFGTVIYVSWRFGVHRTQQLCLDSLQRLAEPAKWIGTAIGTVALFTIIWFGVGHSDAVVLQSPIERARSDAPNIILISLDTLTARHMSLYGYALETTPNLQSLAKESITFDQFYAACNFTTPSFGSIHTGTYPWTHRIFAGSGYHRREIGVNPLAAQLKNNGYQTAAFTDNSWASPRHQMIESAYDYAVDNSLEGIGRRVMPWAGTDGGRLQAVFPFNVVAALLKIHKKLTGEYDEVQHPPDLVYSDALKFLDGRSDSIKPLFLWVHTSPPHAPYVPDVVFQGQFLPGPSYATYAEQAKVIEGVAPLRDDDLHQLSLRYDENIRYADFHFGQFLESLRIRGLLDNSILMVTSDHGESFERGFLGHAGSTLYQNLIHIPLIIKMPRQVAARRIATPASHVDLMPTLLDYAKIKQQKPIEGRSLRALIEGRTDIHEPVFSMNFERNSSFNKLTVGTIVAIVGSLKYVKYLDKPSHHSDELFDLAVDPNEQRNLIDLQPGDAMRLEKLISSRLKQADESYATRKDN